MPRRIPDYPDAYSGWNAIASYGSYMSALSAGLFFFYVVYITLTETGSGKEDTYKFRTV
jgi:cytochrome c oxidase subunit I